MVALIVQYRLVGLSAGASAAFPAATCAPVGLFVELMKAAAIPTAM